MASVLGAGWPGGSGRGAETSGWQMGSRTIFSVSGAVVPAGDASQIAAKNKMADILRKMVGIKRVGTMANNR